MTFEQFTPGARNAERKLAELEAATVCSLLKEFIRFDRRGRCPKRGEARCVASASIS